MNWRRGLSLLSDSHFPCDLCDNQTDTMFGKGRQIEIIIRALSTFLLHEPRRSTQDCRRKKKRWRERDGKIMEDQAMRLAFVVTSFASRVLPRCQKRIVASRASLVSMPWLGIKSNLKASHCFYFYFCFIAGSEWNGEDGCVGIRVKDKI
jgi:hypothetical protein